MGAPADATHWVDMLQGEGDGDEPIGPSRIWRAFGLKSHVVEDSKLSPDPQFVDKVKDVIGLYLNPPTPR